MKETRTRLFLKAYCCIWHRNINLSLVLAEKGLDITVIEPIELVDSPENVLIRNPYKLLKTKEGVPWKNRKYYKKNVVPLIIKHWSFVKQHCIQAAKFDKAISGWLAAT